MTTGQQSSRKSQNYGLLILALLLVAVLAVIFYATGGIGKRKGSEAEKEEALRNVAKLNLFEQKIPQDLSEYEPPVEVPELDIEALKYKLLSHYDEYDYNAEYFRGWFENSCIVGDSVAEAIRGFDYINDYNLQSQIGIGIYSSGEVIEGTEWVHPGTVFLTFAANDIENYNTNIDQYIDDYAGIVNRLQDSIPGVDIYLMAILPCEPGFEGDYWWYSMLDEYNYRLQIMCEETGATYFDMSFIPYNYPDVYAPDGIHPNWQFYPLWLTYMAEIGGLTGGVEYE